MAILSDHIKEGHCTKANLRIRELPPPDFLSMLPNYLDPDVRLVLGKVDRNHHIGTDSTGQSPNFHFVRSKLRGAPRNKNTATQHSIQSYHSSSPVTLSVNAENTKKKRQVIRYLVEL